MNKQTIESDSDILRNSPKAKIYGFVGTAAEQYANDNEIPFVEIPDIPMISLEFPVSEQMMKVGEKMQISPQYAPIDTTDGISFVSSDENIVTVNTIGTITAKKEGSVSIIVTSTNGLRASYTVHVQEENTSKEDTANNTQTTDQTLSQTGNNTSDSSAGNQTEKVTGKKSLKLKSNKATIKKGKKIKIKAIATPAAKITYSSSNKKIASVTAKGVVKAKKKGKVVIYVKANGVTKKFKINVK
jgi:uncharacterized protein YjdB